MQSDECFASPHAVTFAARTTTSGSFGAAEQNVPLAPDRIRDEWNRLGDRMRRRWRKLTREDVAVPDGNIAYLAGLLQQHYGVDRREALLQVFEFESEL